ncbi:MAG: 5-oxoprolinase [Ignavibacteria bacterium GWB2_35_12]|nr:MAG: 5-oxoprolinase [Ignavibacteria bacterium GWA2_35_8]OGU39709.1 MAG: 5-oxoprolinase [Ignavibacteria bacterium GWB2_35_12]OGU96454.1 MAG: 5-oxoprolinase [Ignavibacteria bacterium RIFOXYA2_FULL_35_10]OGV23904.1 MAG: 5-oxoprolinase [Ignavibacteria bacterium RIFOXYC2_FULL_35_21]
MENLKYKLGIDVGGTFTDFILISEAGNTTIHKTLSTPEDPSIGVITGIQDLAEMLGISLAQLTNDIETIVHGTTVATNALLTLKGAKTALITTKGFRDALEMRRGIREEQYNNHYRNVQPLVPRYLRLTVDERIDTEGNVLKKIDETYLDLAYEKLKSENVDAIAICFINSFINHTHEEIALSYFKEKFPDCFITASVEVLPSIRFYERVSTTVVNAYIGPIVANYLDKLTTKLAQINFKGKLLIVQSNGGVVTPDIVKKSPVVTVLSGPAAAPTAGIFYANLLGKKNCITVDMGGTSFDASLVVDNQCLTSTEGEINRYKIALPSLDIVTIGAGGGSIGWLNKGGLLQMGPQSAGASPGPICYDKGGQLPACTDANLILGYLNPDYFAGGKIKLNYAQTQNLMEKELASILGLSLLETAAGMYRIINSNMAQGVRQVSIEKGHDPREFLFIVAGGAGAIHAGEICKELEIPMFMVPNTASIFCAAGMLLGDLKHDYVLSFLSSFSKFDKNELLKLYSQMRDKGMSTLISEGIKKEKIEYEPIMDLRYIGQYHEVQLNVDWKDIATCNLEKISEAFHDEHNRLYGYSLREGAEIESINIRLRCIGKIERPKFLSERIESIPLAQAFKGKRKAFMPETNSMVEVPVYDGDLAISNNKIEGPAIIEKTNTSIFISESYDCIVDKYCSFIVYSKKDFPEGNKLITKNLKS